MICALSRWCTLATHDTSAPQYSDETHPKKLEIVFSENLRDEMARHLNVAAAADNLFLFCIFDRFGFFIFVKGASEGGDRVLTAGKVVKIYEDSFRGKWDDDDHDGDCHGISAQSLKAYYPEHNKLRRRQLKTAIKVVLKGG